MKQSIIIILLSVLSIISCTEDRLITYGGEDDNTSGIYFQRVGSYVYGTSDLTYTDSLTYSFAGAKEEMVSQIINVQVRTFGNISDVDRPFLVKPVVDSKESPAVEGVDFEIEYEQCIVVAGKADASVPVRLLRTSKLTTTSLRLKIELLENEYFKFHIKEYKASSVWNRTARSIDAKYFVLRFDERYTQPSYWSYSESKFGMWTVEKFRVVNEVAGWEPKDWKYAGMAGSKVASGRFDYVARAVQNYLQQKYDNGTPVKEANGSNMQLPSPYEVIYE